nr:ribonuclease H-like domain-containing protein [Tanacetum cinerariifolium]
MAGEDTSQPPPPPIASTEAPQMVSAVKLPILKKDEYIIWTMKMEQYLAHKDYAIWEVILNGNSAVQMTKDEAGNKVEVPLVTTQQILARTREIKAKSTMLMAIPDEHLARFYGIKDVKTLWAAIKTKFGESTSSTNELNTAYSVSTATGHNSQAQGGHASMRVKRFYKKTGRKLEFNGKVPAGFDNTKVECLNCHRKGNFARDCRTARNSGIRSRDAGNAGYIGRDNGKRPAREEDEKALVVQDRLGTYDRSYQVEEEAMTFLLWLSLQILQALQVQILSAKVKTGLGYDSQFNEKEVLDVKKEEVTEIVFDNRSSDEENSLANDRFKKGEGFHAVPLPLTGNYMPPNLIYHLLD